MKITTKKVCFLLQIFVVVFTLGCSTTKEFQADCLTPDYKNFTISWGYNYASSSEIMGYELDDSGNLLFFRQEKSDLNAKKYDTLDRIDGEKLCQLIAKLNSLIVKIPVINEPGKELTFIKMAKPQVGIRTNATWNEHKTYGSREYREFFDTLLAIIPKDLRHN
jgi:hypothetical protein